MTERCALDRCQRPVVIEVMVGQCQADESLPLCLPCWREWLAEAVLHAPTKPVRLRAWRGRMRQDW